MSTENQVQELVPIQQRQEISQTSATDFALIACHSVSLGGYDPLLPPQSMERGQRAPTQHPPPASHDTHTSLRGAMQRHTRTCSTTAAMESSMYYAGPASCRGEQVATVTQTGRITLPTSNTTIHSTSPHLNAAAFTRRSTQSSLASSCRSRSP